MLTEVGVCLGMIPIITVTIQGDGWTFSVSPQDRQEFPKVVEGRVFISRESDESCDPTKALNNIQIQALVWLLFGSLRAPIFLPSWFYVGAKVLPIGDSRGGCREASRSEHLVFEIDRAEGFWVSSCAPDTHVVHPLSDVISHWCSSSSS